MSMQRIHEMPFGAQPAPGGGCRFRLWAPSASGVELQVGPPAGPAETVIMAPEPGGWFTHLHPAATAGWRYRYRIAGSDLWIPDPASRRQPDGVHGPSEVVDPRAHAWRDAGWQGRPWRETVLHELHVGTATEAGTFAATRALLPDLAALGVTAVELMPVAAFPGDRNWGYDGVLPFAPHAGYGTPDDLKDLVEAAHDLGLMVFLDVVYNHFGPEGNYLHLSAPEFFTERHHTPWGAAIDLDGPQSATVRDFFVQNALFWLHEYHLDGLRLDAVHALYDDSPRHVLHELADAVAAGPGRERAVHLVLENDANEARHLPRDEAGAPALYTAQWNDDLHHAFHVALTGEDGGYYADYADRPAAHLARALAEGFAYQGDPSPYRDGERRGEPSGHLPPTAFVSFLQNHDQIGNRAFGERLTTLASEQALRAAVAVQLLAPQVPLLFMGEPDGSEAPFLFFCDFGPDLAPKVTEGRRREFARFPAFADPEVRARIPDPGALDTFVASRPTPPAAAVASRWRSWYGDLLARRASHVVPLLDELAAGEILAATDPGAVAIDWPWRGGGALRLRATLQDAPATLPAASGEVVLAVGGDDDELAAGELPGWSVVWTLSDASRGG
jgi:malto-oligosyltrehalose trehalohydrolase